MQLFKNYFHKLIWLFALMFTTSVVFSQELSCDVSINAAQINVSNDQLFKTLETELSEFVNRTNWTKLTFQEHEKIRCAFIITLTEQKNSSTFSGNIQIQASRPVFNSSYYSPILNHKDNKFTFSYREFQPINYNPNNYESELVSVVTYYIYTIIGVYLDTFKFEGGVPYFKIAQNIANQSQQSGGLGWENSKLDINRFTLNEQLMAKNHNIYSKALFDYHANGMDEFEINSNKAKMNITRSITALEKLYDLQPTGFLIRLFLDAKVDEIVNMFGQKSNFKTESLKNTLRKISSNYNKKWKQLK